MRAGAVQVQAPKPAPSASQLWAPLCPFAHVQAFVVPGIQTCGAPPLQATRNTATSAMKVLIGGQGDSQPPGFQCETCQSPTRLASAHAASSSNGRTAFSHGAYLGST